MNRFGTLALAGALAISVSAASRMNLGEGLSIPARAKTETLSNNVKHNLHLNTIDKLSLKSAVAKETLKNVTETSPVPSARTLAHSIKAEGFSMRKIKPAGDDDETDDSSISGQYTIQIGDYYYEDGAGSVSIAATITEEEDQIVISSEYFGFDVVAGYDESTGQITFSEKYAGTYKYQATTYYINFEPFYWDGAAKKVVLQDWNATYNASTGVITTPADHGFSWMAYTDAALTSPYNYFDIFDVEGFTKKESTGGNAGIAGEYIVYIGDYYFQDSAKTTITTTATIEEGDGYIIISSEYFPSDIAAGYTAATGQITFTEMTVGTLDYYGTTLYINFEPFVYDSNSVINQTWSATFNEATGMITTQADHGLSWAAYSDADLTESIGYLEIFDLEGLTKKSGGSGNESEGNWTAVGEATFMDGWILPGMGVDQTDPANWYDVPVEQNDNNPNLFRLVNPYKYGPLADFNESTKTGYIQFDVTDPDHVVFALVDAGFAYSAAGMTSLYCTNALTFYCNYMGMPADQIVNMAGDAIPYTTFKDNVVTVGSTLTDEGYDNDACFGDQTNPTACFGWTDAEGKAVNMAASIDLSKIDFDNDNVSVTESDSDNMPTRFFNLQGIEITNPAKGQVVIRVKGDKATKQITR